MEGIVSCSGGAISCISESLNPAMMPEDLAALVIGVENIDRFKTSFFIMVP